MDWLQPALTYAARWVEFQMRLSGQPGCAMAAVHRGALVFEQACGHADLATGERLGTRHRFRIASHSKSFTAAGILRLLTAEGPTMGALAQTDARQRFGFDRFGAELAALYRHALGLAP